jgi:hypothetical protein
MSHPRKTTRKIILKAVSIPIFLVLLLLVYNIGELMGREPFPLVEKL